MISIIGSSRSFSMESVRSFSKFKKFGQICFMLVLDSHDILLVRPADKSIKMVEQITKCELLFEIKGFGGYEKFLWQGLVFYILKNKEETALILANDGDNYLLWRRNCTYYRQPEDAFALCSETLNQKRAFFTYSFEKRRFYDFGSSFRGYFCKGHLILEVQEYHYQIIELNKYGEQVRIAQEISSPYITLSFQSEHRFVLKCKDEENNLNWLELIDPTGNTILVRNVTWIDRNISPQDRYLRVGWQHETAGYSWLDLVTGFIYDQKPE